MNIFQLYIIYNLFSQYMYVLYIYEYLKTTHSSQTLQFKKLKFRDGETMNDSIWALQWFSYERNYPCRCATRQT